jgi:prevent-host-death family protein
MANMAQSSAGWDGGAHRISAADAKNQFGRVLDDALAGETVVITRYGESMAVVISAERYRALSEPPGRELDLLTKHFDTMLARMQTATARRGMREAFEASPEEMGRSAVAGARRRSARKVG